MAKTGPKRSDAERTDLARRVYVLRLEGCTMGEIVTQLGLHHQSDGWSLFRVALDEQIECTSPEEVAAARQLYVDRMEMVLQESWLRLREFPYGSRAIVVPALLKQIADASTSIARVQGLFIDKIAVADGRGQSWCDWVVETQKAMDEEQARLREEAALQESAS